jgi:hypothetical protein
LSIQAGDEREQAASVSIEIKPAPELGKGSVDWRKRFPKLDFLRVMSATRASIVYGMVSVHLAWAWLTEHDHWGIVWIGDRLEASIFPDGADPDSFTQVSFEDFINYYGLKVVDDGEPVGYLVPAAAARRVAA